MKNTIENLNCPCCGKLICKKRNGAKTEGILFWCPRCKTNFEFLDKKSAPVADDK